MTFTMHARTPCCLVRTPCEDLIHTAAFTDHMGTTCTRQVMPYERGLHIHSSSNALRTRTPHTLVRSCITHEDSTYTCQVMHCELVPHIHLSGHALRTRTPHTLVRSCITNAQKMAHLLSCRQLDDACTADDLATVTERAKACTRKWEKIV